MNCNGSLTLIFLRRNVPLLAALLAASVNVLAEGHPGHTHGHGEAGHLPAAAVAASDYANTEPPLWSNLGTLSYKIKTHDRLAQRYFDQGLRLSYAFNHAEALRAFRRAQKLDPSCAICFWGEALVLGPNINAPMEPAAIAPAKSSIEQAKTLAKRGNHKERALIEALAKRYGGATGGERKLHDQAYAEAMGGLYRRYPKDDEIAVLYAESLMDLSPWDYWEENGHTPKGRTVEILQVLERVLARNPDHPGAIHYYIHMVEGSDRPERAEAHADRLARLMPGAGHMVHMPGHLYYRRGRYRDALEANRAAIAADEAYLKETGAKGIYTLAHYPHNVHFLMVSAQMAGDGETALDAAAKLAAVISNETARTVPWAQPIKAAPYFAQAQYGRPEAVLKLADPGSEFPYVQAMWRYARGVAAARQAAVREAQAELDALSRLETKADFSALSAAGVPAPDLVRIAGEVLRARIAQARGESAQAIAAFERAAAQQERLPEPPYWYYPVRRSLGALKFLGGDLAGAERELCASLEQVPNDAWALWALAEVQRKSGDIGSAEETQRILENARAGNQGSLAMDRL
ncbi:tetratricopeptide repeat protein [Methylococcus geothermalis]|uniref:Tetratricopeptide repeat protein n=1 Tax=Methylococcus geothermalis TaxID=2681310 RepID=A0A858Q8Q6_9GAMM|nr:hypothetical protein [Methylococcus geothermalis]QJD30086.1 hypothetical protein GNH96_08955 [Methylococcus geothermalis]